MRSIAEQVQHIADMSGEEFGVSKMEMAGPFLDSRRARYVEARHVAMAVARHHLRLSLNEIGEFFDRHHTSVMSAVDHVARDERLLRKRDALIERLGKERM